MDQQEDIVLPFIIISVIVISIIVIVMAIIIFKKADKKTIWQSQQTEHNVSSFFTSLSDKQSNTILRLTSIFENSTPNLQYGYVENIGDGRGYTFGFVGFTTGTYDGNMVVKEYNRIRPNNVLSKYIPALDAIDADNFSGMNSSVKGLGDFPADVKLASSDPLFIQAQLNVANNLYIEPSQRMANNIGLKLAISRGQLYDAYINHGETGVKDIVEKTNNVYPIPKLDEKSWLKQFLKERMNILLSDKTWAESIDRVKVYQKLLEEGNVNLNTPLNITAYGDSFILS